MARVIKGRGREGSSLSTQSRPRINKSRVIEKEVVRAQKEADDAQRKCRETNEERLQKTVADLSILEEKAFLEAGKVAFQSAIEKAMTLYIRRAKLFDQAREDLKMLALEMVFRILGTKSKVSEDELAGVIDEHIRSIRLFRRLRFFLPKNEFDSFMSETSSVANAFESMPEFQFHPSESLESGKVRVALEAIDAVCDQHALREALKKYL